MLFELRKYQKDAVDKIGRHNAIIKMPTGSGKTFVASEFIRRGLTNAKKFDDDATTVTARTTGSGSVHTKSSNSVCELAALFLVPTCDLAEQQCRAIQAFVGETYKVVDYMGRKAVPTKRFDVLVSTPQAFLTVQQREESRKLFDWSNFFCCVFDEVHHALKEHPYRVIAHRIKEWTTTHDRKIQIVGLSASLTYAVGHRAVENALNNLCDDLNVSQMISPTPEELIAGGYIPKDDSIETMHKPWEAPNGVLPESERKPHLMHQTFMQRIQKGEATEFAMKIYKVVKTIESEVQSIIDQGFESPLDEIRLQRWAEIACKRKEQSIPGSVAAAIYKLLEVWYVALRMVCQSWEEEEEFVTQWLINPSQDGFQVEGWFGPRLISSINAVQKMHNSGGIQSEKLKTLKRHLIDKRKHMWTDFRCIIFVKQRMSAYVLAQHLNNDKNCLDYGIKSDFVTARNAKISPSIKVTAGEATKRIEKFRTGEINLIVATSVIEEGFDVPEANVVISYDDLKDTVELCQRFGRARQTKSSLTLMSERRDRPLSALKEVKMHQDSIIKDFKPSPSKQQQVARQQSQNDRERAALSVLQDVDRCERSPLESLNMYTAKTKAIADTEYIRTGSERTFECSIKYTSINRVVVGNGQAGTKKQSQHLAALDILEQLRKLDEKRFV